MWEEKEEGSNDKSSYSKHKKKEAQVSIIKEKHSRYTPPTNEVWEEKRQGSNDESSHSKHKIKEIQVSIIKEIIQVTHHPLIRYGGKTKRGVMMKAAIQNTK